MILRVLKVGKMRFKSTLHYSRDCRGTSIQKKHFICSRFLEEAAPVTQWLMLRKRVRLALPLGVLIRDDHERSRVGIVESAI